MDGGDSDRSVKSILTGDGNRWMATASQRVGGQKSQKPLRGSGNVNSRQIFPYNSKEFLQHCQT